MSNNINNQLIDELRVRGVNISPGTPYDQLMDAGWRNCPAFMRRQNLAPEREPAPAIIIERQTMAAALSAPKPPQPVLDLITRVPRKNTTKVT